MRTIYPSDNQLVMEYKNKIIKGNSLKILKELPDEVVDCCVTSPPYYKLRDYGHEDQIGLEETPEKYVENIINIFREVKRVLKKEGTVWLNLGDSYAGGGGASGHTDETKNMGANTSKYGAVKSGGKKYGLKAKDLIGIPWLVAFALRSDGWYLRQDIIWSKPNPMPESVVDRCTKSHEYIFLLSKSKKYYFDYEEIKEEATGYDGRKDTLMKGGTKYKTSVVPGKKEHTMASRGHERWKFKNLKEKGQQTHTMHENRLNGEEYLSPIRNKRSVWTVNTKPYKEAHFAVYPPNLIRDCILAGCVEGGVVLDPFMGSGTTAVVSRKLNRNYIGIELNQEYIDIANNRLHNELGLFL